MAGDNSSDDSIRIKQINGLCQKKKRYIVNPINKYHLMKMIGVSPEQKLVLR
jgi:hypothetical protein